MTTQSKDENKLNASLTGLSFAKDQALVVWLGSAYPALGSPVGSLLAFC